MLPAPLTAKQTSALIISALKPFADARGALCDAVDNLAHLWEYVQAVAADDKPRIVVCWTGSQARGSTVDQDVDHRDDRSWAIVLVCAKGFDETTVRVGATKESFMDTVEKCRDEVRRLRNVSEEFPVNYRSIRPLANIYGGQVPKVFYDSYAVEVTTAADLGRVDMPADNTNQL